MNWYMQQNECYGREAKRKRLPFHLRKVPEQARLIYHDKKHIGDLLEVDMGTGFKEAQGMTE